MEVWTVTVFESGDFSTEVWGVFDSESKAEAFKKEQLESELNSGDYYLEVKIQHHEVK